MRLKEFKIDHRAVIEKLLRKLSVYIAPFEIARRGQKGDGFVYVTSPCTLEQLYLAVPVDIDGIKFERNVLVRHITLADFKKMVDENFELAMIQEKLFARASALGSESKMTVVVLLRCGHFLLLQMPFWPEYAVCKRMSNYHSKDEALQLGLD